MDEDVRQAAASHRGRAGHEGRHAERLGDHSVQQSAVRAGHILRLDSRLPHSQLDVGRQETQLILAVKFKIILCNDAICTAFEKKNINLPTVFSDSQ